MFTDIVLHYFSALAYLLMAGFMYANVFRDAPQASAPRWFSVVLLLLLFIQANAIRLGLLGHDHIRLNWALGLSITLWLGLLVYWIELHFVKITGFLLLLMPLAALLSLLAALFPTSQNSINVPMHSQFFTLHLLVSLFAYSLMALGALQAIISTALDNFLHKPSQAPKGRLRQVLDAQPPLLVQERLLFRLISIGFALLSVSVLTGIAVSLQRSGLWLPNDHKTFFTLISWFIFGVLLFGRWRWGWRGRVALRWTLLGFVMLMLAYTGTRFIFEEIIANGRH